MVEVEGKVESDVRDEYVSGVRRPPHRQSPDTPKQAIPDAADIGGAGAPPEPELPVCHRGTSSCLLHLSSLDVISEGVDDLRDSLCHPRPRSDVLHRPVLCVLALASGQDFT